MAHGRLAAAAYMSSQELGTPVSVRLLVKHLSLHIKVRAQRSARRRGSL